MNVFLEGKAYVVAHQFSDKRVLIDFEGAFAFADKGDDGTWDLSGDPFRTPEEKAVLDALEAPTRDTTVVTEETND